MLDDGFPFSQYFPSGVYTLSSHEAIDCEESFMLTLRAAGEHRETCRQVLRQFAAELPTYVEEFLRQAWDRKQRVDRVALSTAFQRVHLAHSEVSLAMLQQFEAEFDAALHDETYDEHLALDEQDLSLVGSRSVAPHRVTTTAVSEQRVRCVTRIVAFAIRSGSLDCCTCKQCCPWMQRLCSDTWRRLQPYASLHVLHHQCAPAMSRGRCCMGA